MVGALGGRATEYRKRSAIARYDLTIYSLAALFKALMGKPEEARQALARAEDAGSARAYFTPYWLHYPAMAYATLGDWQRAKELFAQGSKASREGHLQSNIPEVSQYGRLLLSTGETEEAKEIISAGYDLARDRGSIVQQLNLLSLRVEFNASCGVLDRAEDDFIQAQALLMQLDDWKGLVAPVLTAEGSYELPATGMVVPVRCSGWFGATRAAWGGVGPRRTTQAIAVQGFERLNVMRTYPDPLFASNAAGRPLSRFGALSQIVSVSPSRA
jgi:tetratricopeptide (TPR) repeat protein